MPGFKSGRIFNDTFTIIHEPGISAEFQTGAYVLASRADLIVRHECPGELELPFGYVAVPAATDGCNPGQTFAPVRD